MSRRCSLTGKGVQSGNKVSHSNHKTRRRFRPNIQVASLQSEALGVAVRLKVTPATLRSVEHKGGLDAFLLNTSNLKLPEEAKKLKRRVLRALAKKNEPVAAKVKKAKVAA